VAALAIATTTALVLGVTLLVRKVLAARLTLSLRWLGTLFGLGVVAALVSAFAQTWLWRWTAMSPEGGSDGGTSALFAMMILAVPLEEAGKLLAVWPAYQRGRLRDRADGILAAVSAAAGFAIAETSFRAGGASSEGLFVVRSLLGSIGHLLFAGAWGFVLSDASGGRFLRRAWLIVVLFHGLFDHIAYGRGPGTLVVAGPLLFGMLGLGWLGLREARTGTREAKPAIVQVLNEPTFDLIRRAVTRREKPLSLFWILLGSLVNAGVALAAVALAITLGHRLGIDFGAADEADLAGNAPLLLLGSALLAAFPLSGYLIARASGTESVLEPALGAAASIAVVAILLSMATPVAVVFSLAVAPVAFGLSCIGAWFGMGK
jgi:RsiW-degrading membrane proteinase PrsW (M82 family)